MSVRTVLIGIGVFLFLTGSLQPVAGASEGASSPHGATSIDCTAATEESLRRRAKPVLLESTRGSRTEPESDSVFRSRFDRAQRMLEDGRTDEALGILRDLAYNEAAVTGLRGRAFATVGYAEYRRENLEASARAWSERVRLNPCEADSYRNLGLIHSRQGRPEQAGVAFGLAYEREPSLQHGLYRARVLAQSNRYDSAVSVLERSLEASDVPDPQLFRTARETLVEYYLQLEQYRDAYETGVTVAKETGGSTQHLQVARAAWSLEDVPAAWNHVERVKDRELSEERQFQFRTLKARLLNRREGPETAQRYLSEHSPPTRVSWQSYELGLLYRSLGELDSAENQLREAVRSDPDRTEYRLELAYVLLEGNRLEEAGEAFEAALRADLEPSRRLTVLQQLGYLSLRRIHNEEAADWFRRGIRFARENRSVLESERSEVTERIRTMRSTLRDLEDAWSGWAYYSFQEGFNQPFSGGGSFSGGFLRSRAGLALHWTPPVIGFRDYRIFQVFGRMLGSGDPQRLDLDEESLQGSLGVRYKPLRSRNLNLSLERLIPIGDQSQRNWLLRSQYSWNQGRAFRREQDAWLYRSVYFDLAHFTPNSEHQNWYFETHLGRAYRLNSRWMIVPNVVADVQHSTLDLNTGSYAEMGLEVALRKPVLASGTSFETRLEYKWGRFLDGDFNARGSSFRGFLLTSVLYF